MHSQSLIFSDQQKIKSLILLSFFHILIITASNYLVQFTFTITLPLQWLGLENFTFDTTWGTLTFPFIFLATDLTVRIFSASLARRIIFVVMIPALIISYLISTLFVDQQFQGFAQLTTFNLFTFRIALASFTAYVAGQLLDVIIFNRLRQLKTWWIAPVSSMILGSMVDTFAFFAIAFYHCNDPFLAENWLSLGVVDYLFKLVVGVLFFVPAYGVILRSILTTIHKLS